MDYFEYLSKSLQVFILCFILGSLINNLFVKIQGYFNIPVYTLFGFLQLITIISITYLLHNIQFLEHFFEEYTPNVIFSSFLLSLQTNMLNNFKYFI
jgi:hypothetical protein